MCIRDSFIAASVHIRSQASKIGIHCLGNSRGCYEDAYAAEETVFNTRKLLAQLFHFPLTKNVILTGNITKSLNMLLKGLLRPGDHVLVSSMEHNAVMRPLVQLSRDGISFDRIPCRRDGTMILEQAEAMIRPSTKAIITLHALSLIYI